MLGFRHVTCSEDLRRHTLDDSPTSSFAPVLTYMIGDIFKNWLPTVQEQNRAKALRAAARAESFGIFSTVRSPSMYTRFVSVVFS